MCIRDSKYIGEKMSQYEKDGSHEFIFGYEESYGYLAGTHARDKDAVVTALLICEMADYFKKQGKTLIDVLAELSKEYGYCLDKLSSYTLAGKKGLAKIADIMAALRVKDVQEILPDIGEIRDYAKGIDGLPAENVLKFILKDHSWIAVRPSGTEPKIKVYCCLLYTSLYPPPESGIGRTVPCGRYVRTGKFFLQKRIGVCCRN